MASRRNGRKWECERDRATVMGMDSVARARSDARAFLRGDERGIARDVEKRDIPRNATVIESGIATWKRDQRSNRARTASSCASVPRDAPIRLILSIKLWREMPRIRAARER